MSCASVIRRNEKAERVATTPIVASIIGAVEVQEALKWLHREELENGVFTSLCGKMFYYEGAHFSSRLVHFRGYDEGCPEHECWEPVIESPLTTANTIEEALRHWRRLTKKRTGGNSFVQPLFRRLCSDTNRRSQSQGDASQLCRSRLSGMRPHVERYSYKCFLSA